MIEHQSATKTTYRIEMQHGDEWLPYGTYLGLGEAQATKAKLEAAWERTYRLVEEVTTRRVIG